MGIVYLAGVVAGLSGLQARTWRKAASLELRAYGIDVRDPMRETGTLSDEAIISHDFNAYKDSSLFLNSRALMSRNFNDVRQSEVLLVNLLGATRPSIGTIMELGWAYALQKPTVVIIEHIGNPHDAHPMLRETTDVRVSDLEDGIRAVAVMLGLP